MRGEAVGKVDLKYVSQFADRHGRIRTYFRFKGRRHALPDPSDPGFMAAYKRLHGKLLGSAAVVTKGDESLGWLIGRYQAAPEFKALRESTRKEYARILSDIGMAHGTKDWRKLTYEKVLEHIRDPLADTPRKADTYVVILSAVYSWTINRRMATENPCRGVPRLYKKGAGYRAWTRAEMETFAAGATEDEYLIFALALYTGQRAGDLVQLTWFQWDGSGFRLIQNKTGSALYIPAHPSLRTELERRTVRSGTIIATPGDKPQAYARSTISKRIEKACRRMGLSGCTLHGLRTTHATLIAQSGKGSKVIASTTGHRQLAMVEHYTRNADQAALAEIAIGSLPNVERTGSGKPTQTMANPQNRVTK